MAVATVVFWIGRNKFVRVPPHPGGQLGLLDFLASSLLASPLLVLVAVGATVAEEIVQAAMSDRAGAIATALAHIAAGYWPHALIAAGGFALGALLFVVRQQIQQDTGIFRGAVVLFPSARHASARRGFLGAGAGALSARKRPTGRRPCCASSWCFRW
jgi:hypothetical protein